MGGVPAGICAWADRGASGFIFVFLKSGEQTAAEFVKMRGEIEQRH
ncbi:hypothetical protein Pka01_23350 [Planotetraspora kaengkrachanensis]|uniref:Uncharacterized protein n=1 Tax=Planotetraspora kaengkrachanensis TaxID=575193 RepID=A0A8J3LU62_9ACTN|nr:hypothetical protein Pka01_23350 [Planotetraspora kaengkrachanensis]